MSITYRAEKGAPLTAAEIDGNFKELDARLKILEDHPEAGEGLGKIQVHEDQITLTGTFGTDFGTFSLPKESLRPCGAWLPNTPYQKLDLVTADSVLYCCLKDHTSIAWEPDRAHWQDVLSLPKPLSTAFPLYENATLPKDERVGKLAFLLDDEGPSLIFFNGKTWQRLMKGEVL